MQPFEIKIRRLIVIYNQIRDAPLNQDLINKFEKEIIKICNYVNKLEKKIINYIMMKDILNLTINHIDKNIEETDNDKD